MSWNLRMSTRYTKTRQCIIRVLIPIELGILGVKGVHVLSGSSHTTPIYSNKVCQDSTIVRVRRWHLINHNSAGNLFSLFTHTLRGSDFGDLSIRFWNFSMVSPSLFFFFYRSSLSSLHRPQRDPVLRLFPVISTYPLTDERSLNQVLLGLNVSFCGAPSSKWTNFIRNEIFSQMVS